MRNSDLLEKENVCTASSVSLSKVVSYMWHPRFRCMRLFSRKGNWGIPRRGKRISCQKLARVRTARAVSYVAGHVTRWVACERRQMVELRKRMRVSAERVFNFLNSCFLHAGVIGSWTIVTWPLWFQSFRPRLYWVREPQSGSGIGVWAIFYLFTFFLFSIIS